MLQKRPTRAIHANRCVRVFAGLMLIIGLADPLNADGQDKIPGVPFMLALEQELQSLVETVSPSVVTVRAIPRSEDPKRPHEIAPTRSMSVGSGILLDSSGTILTTARVVEDCDDFWIETWEGRLYRGVMLGSDRNVAVLKIEATDLEPACLGDVVNLAVGSIVAAVGNSYGFSGAMTWGTVNGFRPDGMIQLTLGVSAGNSGGALVDHTGRVVGIVNAKISEPYYVDPLVVAERNGEGTVKIPGRRMELPTSPISLAIPISVALRSVARITESEDPAPAYVGVYVEDLTGWYVAHFKTQQGVLVTGVVDQTPASRVGLQLGDIITTIDREQVRSVQRFREIVAQAHPGQRLLLDILRGGKPLKLVVEAGRADVPQMYQPTDVRTVSAQQQALPSSSSTARIHTARLFNAVEGKADAATADESSLKDGRDRAELEQRLIQIQGMIDSLQQELTRMRRELEP